MGARLSLQPARSNRPASLPLSRARPPLTLSNWWSASLVAVMAGPDLLDDGRMGMRAAQPTSPPLYRLRDGMRHISKYPGGRCTPSLEKSTVWPAIWARLSSPRRNEDQAPGWSRDRRRNRFQPGERRVFPPRPYQSQLTRSRARAGSAPGGYSAYDLPVFGGRPRQYRGDDHCRLNLDPSGTKKLALWAGLRLPESFGSARARPAPSMASDAHQQAAPKQGPLMSPTLT